MRRLLARSQGLADFEHPRFDGRMELPEGETFDYYPVSGPSSTPPEITKRTALSKSTL